jgi:hypothetical protein
MFRKILFWMTLFMAQAGLGQLNENKRLNELEKRLDEIELRQNEFQGQYIEGRGQVRSFFSDAITFGGFFESAMTALEGPDTESQLSANSHLLGLNISAGLSEQFQFVTQLITGLNYSLVNPHNNPTLTPSRRQFATISFGALVAQGYVEYRASTLFKLQGGLGYAPYGYAIQQREPVLLKNRSGPQLSASSGAQNLGVAMPLWMGLHALGSLSLDEDRLGYNVYTFSPFTNQRSLGTGARVWLRKRDLTTFGISAQLARDGDSSFQSTGADINGKIQRFGWTLEYAKSRVNNSGTVTESYYFEPFVTFMQDKFLIFLNTDFINNEAFMTTRAGTAVNDPYKKWRTSVGINFLPTAFVRIRLAYSQHDYIGDTAEINGQNRDYQGLDLSVGVTF